MNNNGGHDTLLPLYGLCKRKWRTWAKLKFSGYFSFCFCEKNKLIPKEWELQTPKGGRVQVPWFYKDLKPWVSSSLPQKSSQLQSKQLETSRFQLSSLFFSPNRPQDNSCKPLLHTNALFVPFAKELKTIVFYKWICENAFR